MCDKAQNVVRRNATQQENLSRSVFFYRGKTRHFDIRYYRIIRNGICVATSLSYNRIVRNLLAPRVLRKPKITTEKKIMNDNAYLLRRRDDFGVVTFLRVLLRDNCRLSQVFFSDVTGANFSPGPFGIFPSRAHLNRIRMNSARWVRPTDAGGSRRDAVLTVVGVDPAVAGYLVPFPLVHHHPRLRGPARKRGRRCGGARAPSRTFTHLTSKG